MPQLLVSVRSAAEARVARDAGAHVIDIKEPARGSLGAADHAVWREARAALSPDCPVSVALGELRDLDSAALRDHASWCGIKWCKVGLAGARLDDEWRMQFQHAILAGPSETGWIAVHYLDAEAAAAPELSSVLAFATQAGCAGMLFDTWDKRSVNPLSTLPPWPDVLLRARTAGLMVALAGGLCEADIERLRSLEPDVFAVRGAACVNGRRELGIDAERVKRLVRAVG